ncbi:MAG TPA: acetate uptake transporter [Candidatus Saccharimonadales bacterium]|nr:acetate uptake transporter [Candidatus Saccharimonadales bacterium]
MEGQIRGNPAVVGLAGFGVTTLLLQFHNLGWCGSGVVFCAALMFGGAAQLIAGFQEFKVGNNFGYSAFTAYGAFWLALAFIYLLLDLQGMPNSIIGAPLKITATDIGYFLLAYTIYTVVMFVASLAVHFAMSLTFFTLLLGFIGLDLVFLRGMKSVLTITAIDLIVCALLALYMMGHVVFLQVFGRDILPVGKPLVSKPAPAPLVGRAAAR